MQINLKINYKIMKAELRTKLQDILNSSFNSNVVKKKQNSFFTQNTPYISKYSENKSKSGVKNNSNYKRLDFSIDSYKARPQKTSAVKDYLNKSFGDVSVITKNVKCNQDNDFFKELSTKLNLSKTLTRNKKNEYDFEQLKRMNKANSNSSTKLSFQSQKNNNSFNNSFHFSTNDSMMTYKPKKSLPSSMKKQIDIFTDALFRKQANNFITSKANVDITTSIHSKYGSYLTRNEGKVNNKYYLKNNENSKMNDLPFNNGNLLNNANKKYDYYKNKKLETFMREFDIDNSSLKRNRNRRSNDYSQFNF